MNASTNICKRIERLLRTRGWVRNRFGQWTNPQDTTIRRVWSVGREKDKYGDYRLDVQLGLDATEVTRLWNLPQDSLVLTLLIIGVADGIEVERDGHPLDKAAQDSLFEQICDRMDKAESSVASIKSTGDFVEAMRHRTVGTAASKSVWDFVVGKFGGDPAFEEFSTWAEYRQHIHAAVGSKHGTVIRYDVDGTCLNPEDLP